MQRAAELDSLAEAGKLKFDRETGEFIEGELAEVNAETVVCIIEAMKVMNEIKAEAKGVITQVLVENAKPVEFGQPMFMVE